MRRTLWLALLIPLLLAACDDTTSPPAAGDDAVPAEAPPVPEAALAVIDSAGLRAHIAVLASDEFEGRGTGTPGEEKTIAYIREQMQAAGLEGGAPDGGFFQAVPLLGSTPTEIGTLTLTPEAASPSHSTSWTTSSPRPTSTPMRPRSTPPSCSSATASQIQATSGTTTKTWT